METVTLKLERHRHLGPKRSLSLHDRAKDLCGTLSGGPDLSTRRLDGYGGD